MESSPEPTEEPDALIPVGEEEPALVDQIISVTASDGAVITISELMPADATVTASPVTVALEDGEGLAAYDITIWDADGFAFQPEDHGVTVDVGIVSRPWNRPLATAPRNSPYSIRNTREPRRRRSPV